MTLKEALVERIIILDGAMGTMIQGFDLIEKDFRGERFVGSSVDLKGNNDLLNITYPDKWLIVPIAKFGWPEPWARHPKRCRCRQI